MRRAVLYLRVSTSDQSTENQRLELERVAQQRGWEVVGIYSDNGVSGAKGRAQRPQFDRLHIDAARGRFDVVMSWSVDRLGRSLSDLVAFLSEIHALKIDLYLHQQGIDTTTPAGKAMFQMMGVFAEFERSMIRGRVLAGLQRAKARGTRSGKPIGRPPIDPERRAAIKAAYATTPSLRQVAKLYACSAETVRRCLAE